MAAGAALSSKSAFDDGVDFDLHGGLAAEEIHQHEHAVLAGHDFGNDGREAVEDASGDFDFVSRRDFVGDFMDTGAADVFANLFDGRFGHRGPFVSKVNDAGDAGGVMDAVEHRFPLEVREEIVGEHRLGDDDGAEAGFARETDAGIEDVDSGDLAEVSGSDVFVLGLGTQAKPGGRRHGRSHASVAGGELRQVRHQAELTEAARSAEGIS